MYLEHRLSALLQLHLHYLFLTPGFNGLGTDNRKTRWETCKFWYLVRLILEKFRYVCLHHKLVLNDDTSWLKIAQLGEWIVCRNSSCVWCLDHPHNRALYHYFSNNYMIYMIVLCRSVNNRWVLNCPTTFDSVNNPSKTYSTVMIKIENFSKSECIKDKHSANCDASIATSEKWSLYMYIFRSHTSVWFV